MATDGIHIQLETAPGYEVPPGVRDALERLAEAVMAEGSTAEVEGFGAGVPIPPNPFDVTPGKFGPKEPLQNLCLGGFSCTGTYGDGDGTQSGSCAWIYWD